MFTWASIYNAVCSWSILFRGGCRSWHTVQCSGSRILGSCCAEGDCRTGLPVFLQITLISAISMTSLCSDCPRRVLKLAWNVSLKNFYFPPVSTWEFYDWMMAGAQTRGTAPQEHTSAVEKPWSCHQHIMMQLVSHWVLLILLPQHPLMPVLAAIASTSCSDRSSGCAAAWTPWDSRQDSSSFVSKTARLMHSNWKASLASRHISSLTLPWQWQQDSVTCSLTSSCCQITLWDTQVGTSSFFCAAVAQAPVKSGLCHSRQDKLAWKSSWPWARTAQAEEGKGEGEAEILKKEVTCLRLQGRSVAQAGPRSFLNAAVDMEVRDEQEWGISQPLFLGQDEFLTLTGHFKLPEIPGLLLVPQWPLGSRVGCAAKNSTPWRQAET